MNKPLIPGAIYDQASGLGDETIHGPYHSVGKVRMFGLEVDPTAVKQFLDRYLVRKIDPGLGLEFEFNGNEVCLQVIYFRNRQGAHASFVWRSVGFLIPVEFRSHGTEPTLGFVPVFSFASNMYSVISASEINGCYTSAANMWSPNDLWTEHIRRKTPEKRVFTLDTMVVPEVRQDAEQVNGRLLEVCHTNERTLEPAPSSFLKKHPEWSDGPQTTVLYTLKQFPAARFPLRSCYQSVVKIEQIPTEASTDHPRSKHTLIRLYDYPSHPIYKQLRFAGESGQKDDGTTYHDMAPTFYTVTEGKFHEPLGTTLAYRTSLAGAHNGWRLPS
jgi:hypothetical protein